MIVDIHSHVIWGVDDGAETREETQKMLQEASADGIGAIICTPHVTPGVYEFPEDVFLRHFAEAEKYIREEGLALKLYKGAELLYTDLTPRLLREGRAPAMAGTKHALIEFSPTDTKDHIYDALQKVAGSGFIPIIAHMERYPAIGKISQVKEMKSRFRAMVQINARTLTKKQPLLRRGFFDGLFKEGLADFIATDTHAMEGRGTCMTEGIRAAREKYGDSIVNAIIHNSDRIISE